MVREGLSDEEIPEQELEGSKGGHARAEGMAGCTRGCSGENKGPVYLGGVSQVVTEEAQVSMRSWEHSIQATERTLNLTSWSHHFMANRWGKSGNSVRLYFFGLQNHCRW